MRRRHKRVSTPPRKGQGLQDHSTSNSGDTDPTSSTSASRLFAEDTLRPSLIPLFVHCLTVLLSWVSSCYFDFEDRIAEMALGIGRWFGGAEVEEAPQKVEMQAVEGKKVKRRRKKAEPEQSGKSSRALLIIETDRCIAPADAEYYPGMINLSGVLCYMNSVLQSLASVPSVVNHLDRITTLAMESDLPTPVTDALANVLADLNTPHARPPKALRPHDLIGALQPLPQIRRLFTTREQQDAHELFVVLAEAISDEAMKVAVEIARLRGMSELLSLQAYCVDQGGKKTKFKLNPGKEQRKKIRGLAQPWEGLIARRRVCRACGWCTEVRMDTLGGMELPVPMMGDCTLDSCIAEYLAPELLSGVTCEMCSLRDTLDHYRSEVSRLSLPPNKAHLSSRKSQSSTESGSFSVLDALPDSEASGAMSDKRKRKAKEAKKVETRLEEMLESGIVRDFDEKTLSTGPDSELPIKWQKINSDSVREGVVARAPRTLRLHITRTGMTPYGQLVKKAARVAFPMILDLSRFVASGVWEERSDVHSIIENGVKGKRGGPRILYRLESAILHYGATTSSGHFICIRRKPVDLGNGFGPEHIRKSCPDGCTCQQCAYFGPVRGEHSVPGKGWLQVSDDDVEEVGPEALVDARGAIFMLFYERVGEYQSRVEAELRGGQGPDASESSSVSEQSRL